MHNSMPVVERPEGVSRVADKVIRPLTRILNPYIMRLAGRRLFPMFSVLHHRGHRSGRVYVTPVTLMPRGDWFWMGLMFGQDAGWARNILAAGEAHVRYRGVDYHLVEPTVVEVASVRTEFPVPIRLFMRLVGMRRVLRLRAS